jgi:hypothetical protein
LDRIKQLINGFDWHDFLSRWSRGLLESGDVLADLPPEVIASQWLGYPGATEDQIAQAEARLGTTLPPSYRAFLKASNGWRYAGILVGRLWSTEEIEWFAVRHQEDWIDPWIEGAGNPPPVPDDEYFVYGESQDSANIREEYLQTALEISAERNGGIYLLNPQVVTPEGEWEAWFFANWLAGADRYRSFQEMMQARR